MIQRIITCVFDILLVSPLAFQSDTRTKTLGNANPIIEDIDNTGLFPSAVPSYPNTVIAEFGGTVGLSTTYFNTSPSGRSVGVLVGLKQTSVLGIFLSEVEEIVPLSPSNLVAGQQFDFFLGRKLNSTNVGFRLTSKAGSKKRP